MIYNALQKSPLCRPDTYIHCKLGMYISSPQYNKVVSKNICNKVVYAIVHTFAYIKTIEYNNVVSSSICFACSSWNFVKRYNLHVCNKQGVSQDLEIGCQNLMEISKQGVQIVHLQYIYM